MGLGVHFDCHVRGFGRGPLPGRPGVAVRLNTADDGLHCCIDSALLFALLLDLAFNASQLDGEHDSDRNNCTSSEGSNYLAGIGHH